MAGREGERIRIKRVYDPPEPGDGSRVLVDRLWPRGLRKADAALDAWIRTAAPTPQLRTWFGHDPARWDEFQARYRKELAADPPGIAELLDWAGRGRLTLLYAAKDPAHNHALVLVDVLRNRLREARG